MMITKMSLPRRTFLRGSGVALALPLLDAMVPALTAVVKTAAAPVSRLGYLYYPMGMIRSQWIPTTAGADFEWTPTLAPLAPLRDKVTVVSGLSHLQANSFNDGGADHPRGTAVWLSGVHAPMGKRELRLGTTADQIAAQEFGKSTPMPSLEMALESPSQISCDSGDCFFSMTISWRSATTPNPMEAHPRVIFERLFGDGGSAQHRLAETRQNGSILDSITQEVQRLNKTLGSSDRSKLHEYTDSVREIERRIQQVEGHSEERELSLPERPIDIPESFGDHAKMMFDLQVLAYQADLTRVFTLMLGREASPITFPQIGVPEQHHSTSHHNDRPEMVAKKAKIDLYHIQLFSYFLEKLRATPDGDGNLLDHSLLVYGSGLGDANIHDHRNLPLILAGGAGGRLKGGRHLAAPEDTPMANALMSSLDLAGIPMPDSLGDSTGRLVGL